MPDGSLLGRALVPSQFLPEAALVVDGLVAGTTEVVAPSPLPIEFASALRRLETRGLLAPATSAVIWAAFRDVPIRFSFDIAWVERAREIAVIAGLSKVYDATYLACAEALDAEFVTCDGRFVAALPAGLRARVRLVQPAH
ncbi:MAG: type II toxin-antitoxin system VapC family toxin [Dehalococcoidia bacterium]